MGAARLEETGGGASRDPPPPYLSSVPVDTGVIGTRPQLRGLEASPGEMSPGLRGLWGLLHESPPLSLCFAPVRPGGVPPLSLFGFAPVRLSGELSEPSLGGERAVLPVGAQSLSLQDRIKQIPLACDKKTTGNAALLGHQKQRPARHAGDHIGTDPGHLLKHPSRVLLDSESIALRRGRGRRRGDHHVWRWLAPHRPPRTRLAGSRDIPPPRCHDQENDHSQADHAQNREKQTPHHHHRPSPDKHLASDYPTLANYGLASITMFASYPRDSRPRTQTCCDSQSLLTSKTPAAARHSSYSAASALPCACASRGSSWSCRRRARRSR